MSKATDTRELIAFITNDRTNIPAFNTIDTDQIETIAKELITLSYKAQRLNESACNDPMNDTQLEKHQKQSEATDKRTSDILASIGYGCYTNGDPRGCPYGILSPSKRYNGMGGSECGWRF